MDNYVGNICPVCRQEFVETDKVTVCPDCGMPHHEECWTMNGGCSTFGCAQQGVVEKIKPAVTCSKCGTELNSEQKFCPKCGTLRGSIAKISCSKCGTELADGQEFCPKCGTPKNGIVKRTCSKCGAELAEGQEFCAKCGQKVDLRVDNKVSQAINQFNSGITKSNSKKKRIPIIIAAAVVFLILVAVGIKFVAPKIFINMEGYLEKGNHEKAYEKAKTEADKKAVKVENLVAVFSAEASEMLKDPSSFVLRDAYYNDYQGEEQVIPHLVLYVSGANSYGASVSSYWLYTVNTDTNEWELFTTVSDLSRESYGKYDDIDEMLEKMVNNIARDYIKTDMQEGYKLSKDGVKRINSLFGEDVLDEIDLLDID